MQCTKLSTKNTAVNKIKIIPNRSLGGAGDTGLGYGVPSTAYESAIFKQVSFD